MDFIVALGAWLQTHPQLSGLVFVAVVTAVMTVGIPGGNVLALSSGLLFGTVSGALLTTTGAALAALATHLLVRTTFGRWLDKRAMSQRDTSIEPFFDSGNAMLLILPRLIPVLPFFIVNIALSAAAVPLRTYMWTTIAGVIPIAFLLAGIGSKFRDLQEISQQSLAEVLLSPGFLAPIFLLILITVLGWLFIRRRKPV